MKNDNTILWIMGIVIVAVMVFGNSNLGLFATQDSLEEQNLCASTGGEWMPQPGSGFKCICPGDDLGEKYGFFNKEKGCILCEIMVFPTVMPQEGYMYVSDYDEDGCVIGRHEELIPKKEIVCCKIYGLGAYMEQINIRYELIEESKCSVPEGFTGGGRVIVADSFCEAQKECLFTLNDYCIKLWMLLVAIGGLLILYTASKK